MNPQGVYDQMRTKWQKQTTLNNPLRKHIFARFSQKWAFLARLAKIANFCTHFANLQFLMFKPYFLQKSIKNEPKAPENEPLKLYPCKIKHTKLGRFRRDTKNATKKALECRQTV